MMLFDRLRGKKHHSPNIPLRLVLTIPFVLLTVSTSGLIGYLSWQNGQRSVRHLAQQYIQEVEHRAETHIRSYLNTAHLVNENHANAIGTFGLTASNRLEQYLCRQLQLYPSVSATHLSDPEGNFIGIVRAPDGQIAVHQRQVSVDRTVRAARLNQQCDREQSLAPPGNFDPRDRPWYQAAVRNKQAVWSPIFAWKAAPVIGTNAALPIYNPNGSLRYVLGTSLVLSDISQYLRTRTISRSGQVFIVERNGSFVASSTTKEPFVTDSTGQPKRRSVFDTDAPLLKHSATYLQAQGGLERITQPQQFVTRFDRSNYFLQVFPLVDPRGIDWLVLVIVPEADFMEQISANTRSTLFLSLGALLGSILVGLWLTRSIVQPIRNLGSASVALAHGDWNEESQPQSAIAELQLLNRSFAAMADRIQHSFDQTQTRLNDILSSTITAICRFRIDQGQITYEYFSPSNAAVFGYTAEEFMNDPLLWRSRIHPDDQAAILSKMPPQSNEGSFSTEYRFYHKDGTLRWILDSVRFRRDQTGWIVTGVAIDNTARKQAEQALAESEATKNRILKAIPDLIIWMNADGTCLDVIESDSQPNLYPKLEAIGKSSFQLLPPDLAQARIQAIQQAQESGGVIIYEQQFQLSNTLLYEEVRVISVGDRVLVMVRDISDRHHIDRLKNEFISVVSHELRTPLTAIQGCLGLLETGVYDQRPEKAKRMLQLASMNSDRLVRLVNDILDLERLDSGKVELTKEHCMAQELMQKAVEGVSAIADQTAIALSIEPTPIQVWAAPDAIIQTLTNLLSNAIKFSPSHCTVSVSVHSQPNAVQFQVKDHGRGIPPDKLETIFGRFQQVDVSDSRQKGGTGLGLAICQSIVQQHGGNIWAESVLGQGSTFYFTLPNRSEKQHGEANFSD
ncbi:multi-sensor signal transduction histidine kinase [Leptolyngbya sp. NIES-3755]|nr:multi-sensor signal transduction histidine kinase [Leptolyngbya sp. NIES-3755]